MTFAGWIPIRIYWKQQRPMVDWMYQGRVRMEAGAPFDAGVECGLESAFCNIFRRQTPISALRDWWMERPGLTPAGFVFHLSRSGAGWAHRMLSAVPNHLALSEPYALEAVLRAHFRVQGIPREMQSEWVQGMISALGQRGPGAERLFIQFGAWAIAELPVIRELFPSTPWVFLYRDPAEVLASQVARPSVWATPNALHPALLNMGREEILGLDEDEYRARALGRLCEFGLFHAVRNGGLLINYNQLPDVMWPAVAQHFGFSLSGAEIESMRQCSNGREKPESAGERVVELAARWIAPVYRRLEEARQKSFAAAGATQ